MVTTMNAVLTPEHLNLENIEEKCREARKQIIDMAATDKGCHIGGSLSVIDLLVVLYEKYHSDSKNQIVLSKGHAAAALYSTLFVNDLLEESPALSYGKKNSLLTGHPNHKIKHIPFSTGSLGHGIPYAAGWALSQKLKNEDGIGIAVCGDGELQEGLCWETFQVVQSKEINNFVCVVDINGAQNDGYVKDISDLVHLKTRFESFGFETKEIDGHNLSDIIGSLNEDQEKPLVILAKTIKGKGVPELEGNPKAHYAKIPQRLKNKWKRSLL